MDVVALTAPIEPEARVLGFDLARAASCSAAATIPTPQAMAERLDTRQLGIDYRAAPSRRISDKAR